MRFRNAIKIAFGNYALVFKDLLYKTLFFLLFAVAAGVIFEISFRPIVNLAAKFLKDAASIASSFIAGKETSGLALSDDIKNIMDYVSSHFGGIVASVLIGIFAFYVFRFFSGISDCVVLLSVNGHMSSLSHRPYLSLLFENLKVICKYQLIEAFSALIFTAATVAVMYLFLAFIPVFGIFFAVLICVSARGLYLTVMSRLMSNMLIDGMNFKIAVKNSFADESRYFWKMFAGYTTLSVVYIYAIISSAVFTFGVGEFIVIPFFTLLLACMRQVDYFTVGKKKYFIDYDTIVVPKELRDNDEELLSDVDI